MSLALLGILNTIATWLRAIPAPTEHWATILAAWAWPMAALVIVYVLRKPVSSAAQKLADRFENDDIEIPGFLRVTASTLSTLKDSAVTEGPDTPEAADAKRIESLLEYAGDSEAKAGQLMDWIVNGFGPTMDPEEFLTEPKFAEDRRRAYEELIGGQRQ